MRSLLNKLEWRRTPELNTKVNEVRGANEFKNGKRQRRGGEDEPQTC